LICPGLVVFTLLLIASPCRAEVITTTSTKYYSVDGINKNDILKNLNIQSPIKQNGNTFHAHTQSNIRYEFSWVRKINHCALKKATVYLHITYKYPQLTNKPDKKTLKWWKSYLKKLEEHELVHGAIAIEGAKALDKDLNDIKVLNCTNIKGQIKAVGDFNLRKIEKMQIEYDSLTEHGLKQANYKGR